jgi:Lon protease-like protein
MSRHPFDPPFDALPETLPIFPLPGVLLLPGGELPLNIFEPRYLAMIDDALAGGRLVGMVQPRPENTGEEDAGAENTAGGEALYRTGCAGRIVGFSETEDRRYLIRLAGLIRFDIADELTPAKGYRRVRPDWQGYSADLEMRPLVAFNRERLFAALDTYLRAAGVTGDWDSLSKADDEPLIVSLAMACPFDASEKQALLEAATPEARAAMMTAILEMAAHGLEEPTRRH